jgi:hypothetical protein
MLRNYSGPNAVYCKFMLGRATLKKGRMCEKGVSALRSTKEQIVEALLIAVNTMA